LLIVNSLAYISYHKPLTIMMEQVPEFRRCELFELVVSELQSLGYQVTYDFVTSSDYSVPQRRRRLYMTGTLAGKVAFPVGGQPLPLVDFIDKVPPQGFMTMPERGSLAIANVTKHLEKRVVMDGVNCFVTPIVIETGPSLHRSNSSVGIMLTITKTEAGREGYWCTCKGGFLQPHEIGRLQGFPDDLIPWKELGISGKQFAGMMGNAMTLTVVMAMLPQLLLAGGVIDRRGFEDLRARALAFRVLG
jgi:site-specific DNA-cytosine methylase